MSAHLIFLTMEAMVWDDGYSSNEQWFSARRFQRIHDLGTRHALLLVTDETVEEIVQGLNETLSNVDSLEVIPLDSSEVEGLGSTALRRWLTRRDDWKKWSAAQR
jgi:hypothetical protein